MKRLMMVGIGLIVLAVLMLGSAERTHAQGTPTPVPTPTVTKAPPRAFNVIIGRFDPGTTGISNLTATITTALSGAGIPNLKITQTGVIYKTSKDARDAAAKAGAALAI